MRIWRLSTAEWAGTAFSGQGASVHGGRWNDKGVPVVYCAASVSLACLEAFVNLDAEDMPSDYYVIPATIPADLGVEVLEVASLPADWRNIPAPAALKHIGTAWARSGRFAVLSVPSAVVPLDRNYLLNPTHPDFTRIRIDSPQPFSFDQRLLDLLVQQRTQ